MSTKHKGFTSVLNKPKKQLSKGIDPYSKSLPELISRTLNTPNGSIYIWRKVTPLMITTSKLINPYVYEVKKLPIDENTLDILDSLNDGIYLRLIGYIWEGSIKSQVPIEKLNNADFLGIGIDLDAFANYVNKRLETKGKFNIRKRIFYVVGDKRVK